MLGDSCIDKFAELYRLLKPADQEPDDRIAAEKACAAMDDFLKEIGMWFNWKSLGIDETGAEQYHKAHPKTLFGDGLIVQII